MILVTKMPLHCSSDDLMDTADVVRLLALDDVNDSSALLRMPTYNVSFRDRRTLYVHQGEIAYDVASTDFDIVCSDDATTCIILLLSTRGGDTGTERFLVTHVGSQKCVGQLAHYLDDMEKRSMIPEFSVHICGGMDMQTNSELYVSVMQLLLARDQANYYLETLTSHNSVVDKHSITRPVKMGFGFVRQSLARHLLDTSTEEESKDGSSDDTTFRVIPIHIPRELRGPAVIVRELKTFTDEMLHCIYPIIPSSLQTTAFDSGNSTAPRVFISHLDIDAIDESAIMYFRQVLLLSDEALLKYTSTSPLCEPNHFVGSLRSSWGLLLNLIDNGLHQEREKEDLTCFRQAKGDQEGSVYELSPANEWHVLAVE